MMVSGRKECGLQIALCEKWLNVFHLSPKVKLNLMDRRNPSKVRVFLSMLAQFPVSGWENLIGPSNYDRFVYDPCIKKLSK